MKDIIEAVVTEKTRADRMQRINDFAQTFRESRWVNMFVMAERSIETRNSSLPLANTYEVHYNNSIVFFIIDQICTAGSVKSRTCRDETHALAVFML